MSETFTLIKYKSLANSFRFNILKSVLFTLNIVAGSVLIFSTLASHYAPSHNTWIQAFGLIYPIIIIVNLVFLFYWIIAKSRLAVFSLVILLIGFNNIFDNFQMSSSSSSDAQQDQIKVLSYNVQQFGEQTKDESTLVTKSEIINFLIDQNADIVCLQEYHSANNELYKPIKEIRDTLNAETYYYESYFNPKYNQLSGLVTFSKYKAVNKGKLKFTGSRTFGIYTDVLINDDTIRIFNIHLASIKLVPADLDFVVNPDADNSDDLKSHSSDIYNKLIQAYLLREKQLNYLVNEIKSTKYEIILCGDFNDTPSSWVYNQLETYLTDTFVKKGSGIGRTYAGPLPFLRIDYILAGNNFNTVDFTRHDLKRSDHFPISAILTP